jgi:hypothetical protein
MAYFFGWSDRKAESNFKKHGVSFRQASGAFCDPFHSVEFHRIQDFERQWKVIGRARGSAEGQREAFVTVICNIDTAGSDEYIWIISARPSERIEVDFCYEQHPSPEERL